MTRWFIWLLIAPCSIMTTTLAPAQVVLSDSTFSDANWQTVHTQAGVTGGSLDFAQVTTGGDPGSYGQLTLTTPTSNFFYVAAISPNLVYNPSVQGAITSINFSVDYEGTVRSQFLPFFGFEQDGVFWKDADMSGMEDAMSWTAYAQAGVVLPGGREPDAPDFSSAGGPMEFGFLLNGFTNAPIHETIGLDNFSVRITPVPEPPSWIVFAVGTVMSLLFCRSLRFFRPASC